jgi:hypothetical protein
MPDEAYTTKRLLALRKLTRAVADLLHAQVREYLTALSPLFHPRAVFGGYLQGGPRETQRGAEAAFKELQRLYQQLSVAKPFSLPAEELRSPVELTGSILEITPVEYSHVAKTERETKTLLITKPLQWILSYTGFNPRRFEALLADRNRNQNDVRELLLHYLAIHLVTTRQTGLAGILDALHFPISTGRLPWSGELPVTFLTCTLPMARPPDEVIIESTEISGKDAFEEVVNVDEFIKMGDPFKDRLLGLAKSQGIEAPQGETPASSR